MFMPFPKLQNEAAYFLCKVFDEQQTTNLEVVSVETAKVRSVLSYIF